MIRTETTEATRDRVLRLADALFARRGYAAVSMRDVALASGVTKPALYYHFRDKDALFTECLLVHQLQLGERLRDALAVPSSLGDRVTAAAVALIAGAAHHPARTRADALEHLPEEGRLRVDASFEENVTRPLTRLFEEAAAERELRPAASPALAASALVALCTASLPGVSVAAAAADEAAIEALARQVTDLVLRGVAA